MQKLTSLIHLTKNSLLYKGVECILNDRSMLICLHTMLGLQTFNFAYAESILLIIQDIVGWQLIHTIYTACKKQNIIWTCMAQLFGNKLEIQFWLLQLVFKNILPSNHSLHASCFTYSLRMEQLL